MQRIALAFFQRHLDQVDRIAPLRIGGNRQGVLAVDRQAAQSARHADAIGAGFGRDQRSAPHHLVMVGNRLELIGAGDEAGLGARIGRFGVVAAGGGIVIDRLQAGLAVGGDEGGRRDRIAVGDRR